MAAAMNVTKNASLITMKLLVTTLFFAVSAVNAVCLTVSST